MDVNVSAKGSTVSGSLPPSSESSVVNDEDPKMRLKKRLKKRVAIDLADLLGLKMMNFLHCSGQSPGVRPASCIIYAETKVYFQFKRPESICVMIKRAVEFTQPCEKPTLV